MRIVTTVPQHDLRATREAALDIEARGFDGLCSLENRHEPFMPLAVAAVATDSVMRIGAIIIKAAKKGCDAASRIWLAEMRRA